ncbi:MAG: DUF4416 family protein [bacterium]
MGEIKLPKPVKLIVGMISGDNKLFELAQQKLMERFGEIDFFSQILPFDSTNYYSHEMGISLKRKFISFAILIDPGQLPDIKIFTNLTEKEFSFDSKRRINLDPGYISLSKLVLATTKDYQHRIYLRDGIYGEVTLRFKSKEFQNWEWTYPDYRTETYQKIFLEIRKLYVEQLKSS